MSEKSQEEDKSIKKIMSIMEIKDINVHDFISKKMKAQLEDKYGKTFFPMLGIVFDDKKKFLFLFHDSIGSIAKNKCMVLNQENFSEDDIKEFIHFVKKNTNGE